MSGDVVAIQHRSDRMKRRNVAVLALMPEAIAEDVVQRIGRDHRVLAPERPLRQSPTEDDLRTLLAEADGVIIGPGKLTKSVFDAAPRLGVVSKFGSGTDTIDLDEAARRDIVVTNTPGANVDSVADLVLTMILSLARRLREVDSSLRAGTFDRLAAMDAVELRGKTLGVLGFGDIGKRVARRGACFGMEVLAFSRRPDLEYAQRMGVEIVSQQEVIERSDFLSLNVPLTPETQQLITADELRSMKQGAFIINTARGGVVDEEALFAALTSGHLGGAGLDVFATEPPGDHPLFALPNVVVTPHLAGFTSESIRRTAHAAVDNLLLVLGGQPCPHVVTS